MGGGGWFYYPTHIWTPSGGWYKYPQKWKGSTAKVAGVVGLVIMAMWSKGGKIEKRPLE